VIPGEKNITLEFTENDEVLNLTLDGQQSFELNRDDKLTISIKNERLTFLKKDGDNFFKTLREKLHWGETLR
jgi:NAD kinase